MPEDLNLWQIVAAPSPVDGAGLKTAQKVGVMVLNVDDIMIMVAAHPPRRRSLIQVLPGLQSQWALSEPGWLSHVGGYISSSLASN